MSAWTTQGYAARPTPGCRYVARVSFVHGDRQFKPGDTYPLAELGVHEFTAIGMWKAGMLAVAEAAPSPPVQPAPAPAAPPRFSRLAKSLTR